MANDSTGKWVQRAATTGGGRTYRGQMPVNFYASLVLICVIGLFLVGLSRYQLSHRTVSSAGPPTTSQTWYAGLGINVCGTFEPNLPASTNKSTTGLVADGNGVVVVSPKNSSESGSNATLGTFVSHYRGLELTNQTLRYPGKRAYSNGDVCPTGTPDAGKPGVVIVYSWPNFASKQGAETSGDPQKLLFQNGQLITMAFVPANSSIPKPPASVITSLITADQSGPSSPVATTPSGSTTATTAPALSTTPTTPPVTATTAPATATTAPAHSTTPTTAAP